MRRLPPAHVLLATASLLAALVGAGCSPSDASNPVDAGPDSALPDSGSDTDASAPDTASDSGAVATDVEEVPPEPLRDWVAFNVTTSGTLDRVGLAPADGNSPAVVLPADGEFVTFRQPSFHPDGTSLLYVKASTSSTDLRSFIFETGLVDVHLAGEFAAFQFPQWSPDGTRVVFRGKLGPEDDWSHWIWDARDDSLIEVVSEDTEEDIVSALSWSCDGTSFFHARGTGGFNGVTDVWEMNIDGSGAEQLTFGLNPSNILFRVSPSCDEILIDSLSEGQVLRIGTLQDAPAGSLVRGFSSPLDPNANYANCAYLIGGRFACERLSGPGPDFEPCEEGGSQCVLDIVVLDANGEVTNTTRSLEVRETFPVAARLAAEFQP